MRDFRDATKTLPQSLDTMYDDIWARINLQDSHPRYLAHQVLCWIWCAKRQLTVKELQYALATRTGDTTLDQDGIEDADACLSCCQGMVAIDSGSGIIRLVHYSAQEYLDQKGNGYFPDAHRAAAETCLTYLMFDDFQRPAREDDWPLGDETTDISGLWVLGTSQFDEASENQACELTETLINRYPFLNYAAGFWGCHAQGDAEALLEETILPFVQNAAALANSLKATYNDNQGLYKKSDGLYRHLFRNLYLLGRQVPLFVLAYFGLEITFAKLLENPLIASSVGNNQSVLAWSLSLAQERIAQLLIQQGADLSGMFEGSSAMAYAIRYDLHETARIMLQKGGSSLLGSGELISAIEKDCAWVIQAYLDAAPDPGSRKQKCNEIISQVATLGGVSGVEGFMKAMRGLDPFRPDQILDIALAEGGDLEDTCDDGLTVLQRCITKGLGPCSGWTTQRLISRGANIMRHTVENQSVLHLATVFENGAALSVLLQNCAGRLSLDAYDVHGFTPLHYAVAAGDHKMVLELIHKGGANQHLRTEGGLSILHIAAMHHGDFRLVPLSILQGLLAVKDKANHDVNIRGPQGRTPLHYAAEVKDIDAMRELVLAGADLDAADSTGNTALQMSARLVPLIARALEAGHDVTRKIHENKTQWHLLTLLHKREKICRRIQDLEALDPEDLPKVATDRKYCLQHLAEIEKRLHDEFSGYDMTQHLEDSKDVAQCYQFDYTELEKYNDIATHRAVYSNLWTKFSARDE